MRRIFEEHSKEQALIDIEYLEHSKTTKIRLHKEEIKRINDRIKYLKKIYQTPAPKEKRGN